MINLKKFYLENSFPLKICMNNVNILSFLFLDLIESPKKNKDVRNERINQNDFLLIIEKSFRRMQNTLASI